MAYTLSDARSAVKSQVLWMTRAISFEPLRGLVDGANKVFHLPYVPAASGTVALYDQNGTVIASGYTVNSYDTGQLTFAAAPSDVRYASYTAQAFTDSELDELCVEGFAEMQSRYPRTLFLVESGGATYLSTDSGSVVEPSYGGVVFSANPVQKRLLNLCCRFALLQRLRERSATEDHLFKESGRIASMVIDTVDRPRNLGEALAALSEQIDRALLAAQVNAGDESVDGGLVGGGHSDEYLGVYDWTARDRWYR